MSQAASCNLFLYSDDSCLVSQHKDVNEIENEDSENMCDYFVDNKLNNYVVDEKIKSIFFHLI